MNEKSRAGIDLGLTREQQKILLKLARESLEASVKREKMLELQIEDDILMEKRGAFVTLTKNGKLRGCIGMILSEEPLAITIVEMAKSAALDDPRFPDVSVDELKDIKIEISALTPMQQIKDVNEIVVGKHGIYIKQGWHSGLLLPQVATDWGWNRTEFLAHTCNKAGLPAEAWEDSETEIYIFSAQIFSEK